MFASTVSSSLEYPSLLFQQKKSYPPSILIPEDPSLRRPSQIAPPPPTLASVDGFLCSHRTSFTPVHLSAEVLSEGVFCLSSPFELLKRDGACCLGPCWGGAPGVCPRNQVCLFGKDE